ncbi:DUF6328 family protein [Rhodococcus sp. IEGM 1307]|uniref:DUF6328 family protein n=1 Tax=Rhodococcus sp. IEGM 1307 TaxID=3047091 RepID=UPI0032D5A502
MSARPPKRSAGPPSTHGREVNTEEFLQRLTRNSSELLQELRVAQAGVQIPSASSRSPSPGRHPAQGRPVRAGCEDPNPAFRRDRARALLSYNSFRGS